MRSSFLTRLASLRWPLLLVVLALAVPAAASAAPQTGCPPVPLLCGELWSDVLGALLGTSEDDADAEKNGLTSEGAANLEGPMIDPNGADKDGARSPERPTADADPTESQTKMP